MKILFVNPHYPHDPYTLLLHPPLCYAFMSRHLKAAGHHVVHVDLPFLGNDPAVLATLLEEERPDVVGITSVAQSYCQALELARLTKAVSPEARVVFGGPHATFVADECLRRHPSVDYVLLYDAEQSIVALCAAIGDGREAPDALANVPGLCCRRGDGTRSTTPEPPRMDLDALGRPDRSIFDLRPYLAYDYETVVMTARGEYATQYSCCGSVAGAGAAGRGAGSASRRGSGGVGVAR